MQEKFGSPRSMAALLVAMGKARNEEEAEELIRSGKFKELVRSVVGNGPGKQEKLAEQLDNTIEEEE